MKNFENVSKELFWKQFKRNCENYLELLDKIFNQNYLEIFNQFRKKKKIDPKKIEKLFGKFEKKFFEKGEKVLGKCWENLKVIWKKSEDVWKLKKKKFKFKVSHNFKTGSSRNILKKFLENLIKNSELILM